MQPVLFLPDGIVHRLGKYAYEIRYEARQKARKRKGRVTRVVCALQQKSLQVGVFV